MTVERPAQVPEPDPRLGRLGAGLAWLAATQGAWPPHAPKVPKRLDVTTGEGVAAARAEADALADSGVDLLALEASGDDTAALVVICALLDLEPVAAVGTSTAPGWAERLVAVRDGLRAARHHVGDPERLVADPALGRATGLLAQAALRRTPVVLGDSAVVAAAALAAERLEPDARHWWLASSRPASSAARLALADLPLEPLLDLGLQVPGAATLTADLLVWSLELLPSAHV